VTTAAPPSAVFTLLEDGSTWPDWSPLESFELIEPGDGAPEGLGAVRLFKTGRHKSLERVVTIHPDTEFSYILLDGMPIRDYQAVITLVPADGGRGTTITWRSTFRAKVPGTGWLYRLGLGTFMERTVLGLGEAAARMASDVTPPRSRVS
jgi:hypothetical protein